MKQIIGIDPGTANLGWCVIQDRKPIDYGVIITLPKIDLPIRLASIRNQIRKILRKYPEADIHIEHPGYNHQYGSQYVWMTIGIISAEAATRTIKMITATRARKQLLKDGSSDKKQVREKIADRFGKKWQKEDLNTTDALCVALAKK